MAAYGLLNHMHEGSITVRLRRRHRCAGRAATNELWTLYPSSINPESRCKTASMGAAMHTCAGATDAQDGPATNEPWIRALQWPGRRAFNGAERRLWRMPAALVRLGPRLEYVIII